MNFEHRHRQPACCAKDEGRAPRAFGAHEKRHGVKERLSACMRAQRVLDACGALGRKQQMIGCGRRIVQRCNAADGEIQPEPAKRQLHDARNRTHGCRQPRRIAMCAELRESIREQTAVRRKLEDTELAKLRRAIDKLLQQSDRGGDAMFPGRHFKCREQREDSGFCRAQCESRTRKLKRKGRRGRDHALGDDVFTTRDVDLELSRRSQLGIGVNVYVASTPRKHHVSERR